jgi:dephospho-CoA kinase
LEISKITGLKSDFAFSELRSRLLEDFQVRRAVNRLMHPLIGQINQGVDAEFFEVPFLCEACLYDAYDQVWVVTCGRETQMARLIARYGDATVAHQLLGAQMSSVAKSVFADLVLRTNRSLESVRLELDSTLLAMKQRWDCRLG